MEERERVRSVKAHYRSGRDELARDFFAPCLNSCVGYRRAVGFFSSSALITWSGVLPTLARGSRTGIQLLIAPILSLDDRDVLRDMIDPGERDRFLQEIADKVVLEALAFVETPEDSRLRRRLFAWMIATGRLDLRFAFPKHVDDAGIFHEKIGLFDFPWGDQIAFTGSANESTMGHTRNYETVDVYRSWLAEDCGRVAVKEEQFDEAWNGVAAGLTVRPLSEAALAKVRSTAPTENPLEADFAGDDRVHEGPAKWRHQDEAIEQFLGSERGVLEMATGTGKTRTALDICRRLLTDHIVDSVIVAADGTDLLDQWYAELVPVALGAHPPLSVVRHYEAYHERDRFVLDPTRTVLLVSRPALAPALRRLSQIQRGRTVLIHDEVHRLGSPANRTSLSGLSTDIRFRLGLSATPEREYDQEGTDFIESHVGPVIYTFELSDAIRRGVLAPFDYHAIEYAPDENDRTRVANVYKMAAARKHSGNPMSPEEIWTEIARVHKTSRAKLPLFDRFIRERQHLLERCIVFVETMEYGEEVLEILHRYRSDFHTYYTGEDSETLRRFARGELQCLVTCHRLSEGIDIRSLATVILFSSARTRLETIQRMGRCLRVDPRNPRKRAKVVDFIRIGHGSGDNADSQRREWLSELAAVEPGG